MLPVTYLLRKNVKYADTHLHVRHNVALATCYM